MNNWRLLLLAVVVVVQPIGSFTESNLIDGRECCERSEDARLYRYSKTDERRSLDGNREDRRIAYEDRQLRSDVREERRYETTRGPMLTRSESLERNERRFSPELRRSTEPRLIREQERRHRDTFARIREAREDQNRNRDESRNILGQNERDSRESRNRDALVASRTLRLSRDERDTNFVERETRNTMSRSPIRTLRSHEERHSTENKERYIDKENVARSDIRRDLRLSASARADSRLRTELDENRERRIFDRRTDEDGTEFRRSRFSYIEQNERNNRDFGDTKAELQKDQRESELRDRIRAVRRDTERYSTDRARESRLAGARVDNRINERIDKRSTSRQYAEIRRNTNEKRVVVDARETRAANGLVMNTRNDVRLERRPTSLEPSMLREIRDNRLSRSSVRNIRDDATTRDVRDGSSDERRQERNSNRLSMAHTEPMQETRRTIRNDNREPSEERRQREVRNSVEQMQESRIVSRRDVRESSDDRRQQREFSRLSRDWTIYAEHETRNTEPESRRSISERPEQRRLQSSRVSRSMHSVHVIRDNTDRESRKDARESVEGKERENNFSRDRVSMLREKREVRDSNEGTQEARKIVRSDLRRHVLERSIERARMTRSENEERRNNARKISRTRSVDALRTREDTRINEIERQQTRGQDRAMKQLFRNVATPRHESRQSSQSESIRLERDVRNRDVRENTYQHRTNRILERATSSVLLPQRIDTLRSSRIENIQLERLVRNRVEARENERQDMQRDKRDGRTFSNRRSSERFAERRQENRAFDKDSREIRMARNRDEVKGERVLAERRQENRGSVKESREVRMARNPDNVRGERVLAERRQENRDATRDSRNIRETRNRDLIRSQRTVRSVRGEMMTERSDSRRHREARDFSSLLRESHGNELTARSRDFANARSTERQVHLRSSMADVRESKNDIRGTNDYVLERLGSERGGRRESRSDVNMKDAMDQDEPVFSNWQMLIYTLQGVYLCGLLVQMLTENANKKKRFFNWWSSAKNLIKVD